jgi:hypothetical protein
MTGESFLVLQGNGNDCRTADCPFQWSNMPEEGFLASRGKGNDHRTVDFFRSTERLDESMSAFWGKRNIIQSDFGEETIQCLG